MFAVEPVNVGAVGGVTVTVTVRLLVMELEVPVPRKVKLPFEQLLAVCV